MKKTYISFAVGLVLLCFWGCSPKQSPQIDSIERIRKNVFRHHVAMNNAARVEFDQKYNELLASGSRTPAAIANALGVADIPVITRDANGTCEQNIIEIPATYTRVIVYWNDAGEANGYAWELNSPASDNVSWINYLAEQTQSMEAEK